MEIWKNDDNSVVMYVHDRGTCVGAYCTIHNPSNHWLSIAPQSWNETHGVMMRMCSHGQWHIDADEIKVLDIAVNGCWADCDTCCKGEPVE